MCYMVIGLYGHTLILWFKPYEHVLACFLTRTRIFGVQKWFDLSVDFDKNNLNLNYEELTLIRII
jgi:hypothetical protein